MLNRPVAAAMVMAIVVGGGVAGTVRAQTPSPLQSAVTAPRHATLVQLGSAQRSGPFAHLFVLPGDQALHATPAQPVLLDKPRVVCGMTIIPVDPKIDPKMRVEQKNGNVWFTLRTVPPPMCK